MFSFTCFLPNRSSYRIFRMDRTDTFPSISSPTPGIVLQVMPVASHAPTIRLISFAEMAEIAIMISSISSLSEISLISPTVPKTGIPWIVIFRLKMSSSTSPTTWYLMAGFSLISLRSFSLADPAPTMSNRSPSLSHFPKNGNLSRSCLGDKKIRIPIRIPDKNMNVNNRSRIKILRGNPTNLTLITRIKTIIPELITHALIRFSMSYKPVYRHIPL